MMKLYIAGLFLLGCVSMYSLIQARTNRWLMFVMIPLVLGMCLYTWQAITVLRGKPIPDLPIDENVEVVWVTNQKPQILLLLRHDDEFTPIYYSIPWTQENAKRIAGMEKIKKNGIKLEGKFKVKRNWKEGTDSWSIDWEQTRNYSDTNPKNLH